MELLGNNLDSQRLVVMQSTVHTLPGSGSWLSRGFLSRGRQAVAETTGLPSFAGWLVVVHFRRVRQEDNHDPEVKQSLRKGERNVRLSQQGWCTTGRPACAPSEGRTGLCTVAG